MLEFIVLKKTKLNRSTIISKVNLNSDYIYNFIEHVSIFIRAEPNVDYYVISLNSTLVNLTELLNAIYTNDEKSFSELGIIHLVDSSK